MTARLSRQVRQLATDLQVLPLDDKRRALEEAALDVLMADAEREAERLMDELALHDRRHCAKQHVA